MLLLILTMLRIYQSNDNLSVQIWFRHLVIPSTQLIWCEQSFFPAPPQEVVVLIPTLLQSYLFQLRISEFSVNKNQKHLLNVSYSFTLCLQIAVHNVPFPADYLNLRTVSPETPWLILPHPATTAVLFWMCWCPVGRQTVPLHVKSNWLLLRKFLTWW